MSDMEISFISYFHYKHIHHVVIILALPFKYDKTTSNRHEFLIFGWQLTEMELQRRYNK